MKALKYIAIALAGFFMFVACRKEYSFENGVPVSAATGSLKDTSGNCLPISVKGLYIRNSALTDSNNVVIQVNFSSPGSYSISTDTSNGFSFQGSGIMADSGLQSIILKGIGKPVASQLTNFAVSFDSSVCMFSVIVSDSAITIPTTSNDYFPTSDSSNWKYMLAVSPNNNLDSLHVEVSKTDRIISGNTYRTFVSTLQGQGNTDTNYYRKGGGLYYEYGDLNDIFLFDEVQDSVDYIFLKDNVPVGTTWESPEVNATWNTIAGKAKIKFTIQGKATQVTIGNTQINDSVIQVQREYMFSPAASGLYTTIVTGQFYYAKNLGFIKAEAANSYSVNIARWEIHY